MGVWRSSVSRYSSTIRSMLRLHEASSSMQREKANGPSVAQVVGCVRSSSPERIGAMQSLHASKRVRMRIGMRRSVSPWSISQEHTHERTSTGSTTTTLSQEDGLASTSDASEHRRSPTVGSSGYTGLANDSLDSPRQQESR